MSTLQEDMNELRAALSETGRLILTELKPLLDWMLKVLSRS